MWLRKNVNDMWGSHDDRYEHRVDGDDMEPNGRLHEDLAWMQELLCRENGKPANGDEDAGI